MSFSSSSPYSSNLNGYYLPPCPAMVQRPSGASTMGSISKRVHQLVSEHNSPSAAPQVLGEGSASPRREQPSGNLFRSPNIKIQQVEMRQQQVGILPAFTAVEMDEIMWEIYFLEDKGNFDEYLKKFVKLTFPIERFEVLCCNEEYILNQLLEMFVGGLCNEIRLYISKMKPTNLFEAMNLAIYYEDRVKCKGAKEGDGTTAADVEVEQLKPRVSLNMKSLDSDTTPQLNQHLHQTTKNPFNPHSYNQYPHHEPQIPTYGFQNLERQTIVLADGTTQTYLALPADYPFPNPNPQNPILNPSLQNPSPNASSAKVVAMKEMSPQIKSPHRAFRGRKESSDQLQSYTKQVEYHQQHGTVNCKEEHTCKEANGEYLSCNLDTEKMQNRTSVYGQKMVVVGIDASLGEDTGNDDDWQPAVSRRANKRSLRREASGNGDGTLHKVSPTKGIATENKEESDQVLSCANHVDHQHQCEEPQQNFSESQVHAIPISSCKQQAEGDETAATEVVVEHLKPRDRNKQQWNELQHETMPALEGDERNESVGSIGVFPFAESSESSGSAEQFLPTEPFSFVEIQQLDQWETKFAFMKQQNEGIFNQLKVPTLHITAQSLHHFNVVFQALEQFLKRLIIAMDAAFGMELCTIVMRPLLRSIVCHEDERSVLRNLFLNASSDLPLWMLSPQCLMHHEGSTFKELPAHDLAMQSNAAVVLDHKMDIFIWLGAELASQEGQSAEVLAAFRTFAEELRPPPEPPPKPPWTQQKNPRPKQTKILHKSSTWLLQQTGGGQHYIRGKSSPTTNQQASPAIQAQEKALTFQYTAKERSEVTAEKETRARLIFLDRSRVEIDFKEDGVDGLIPIRATMTTSTWTEVMGRDIGPQIKCHHRPSAAAAEPRSHPDHHAHEGDLQQPCPRLATAENIFAFGKEPSNTEESGRSPQPPPRLRTQQSCQNHPLKGRSIMIEDRGNNTEALINSQNIICSHLTGWAGLMGPTTKPTK